jgi:hypothetical protein
MRSRSRSSRSGSACSPVWRRRALVAPIQAGELDPNTPEGFAKVHVPFMMNLVFTGRSRSTGS